MTRESILGDHHPVSDMTSQEASLQALVERERWLAALLEHSSDLIAVVDDQARVLYANPATERMLGYVPDEQLGRSLFELIHPDDLDATGGGSSGDSPRRGLPHPPCSGSRPRPAIGESSRQQRLTA